MASQPERMTAKGPEDALLDAVQVGDESAFGALVERPQRRV
jgi:hypothetical protein